MRVEGIVHPTTAEIDLKEEIGKAWGVGEVAGSSPVSTQLSRTQLSLRLRPQVQVIGPQTAQLSFGTWPPW
jgi:hypothetical protein